MRISKTGRRDPGQDKKDRGWEGENKEMVGVLDCAQFWNLEGEVVAVQEPQNIVASS